ncbi:MAG: DUF4845 domain-containing protein [Lysobacter sp.]|nr:DUF4845 domain-containing protein [Lysobacter sp.]
MKGSTRHAQQGLTLIGFLIVLAVVGLGAYIGMKLFPMYQEFYSVKSSLKGLSNEPGIAGQAPEKIQDLFFRRLYINYSENVKPENVKLTRIDKGWKMDVNYEVRKPMIYNIDVVGKFTATQELVRGGTYE